MKDNLLVPSVTVVIPVRPMSTTIQGALQSLTQQTFENWRVLGLLDRDNGQIRKTFAEILPAEKYKLVDVDVSESGLGAVRNLGIELSDSEFIAMLDCDDLSLPNRFQDQMQLMKDQPNCGIVVGEARVVDVNGKLQYKIAPPVKSRDIKNRLLQENCIVQSTVLMRKSIIKQAGGYRRMTHGCEDYDLWLRMISITDFFSTQTEVVQYLVNPVGVTRKRIPRPSIKHLNRSRKAAQKYLNVPLPARIHQSFIWNLKELLADMRRLGIKISS